MKILSNSAKKRRRQAVSTDDLEAFRQSLPVYAYRKQLIRLISTNNNRVVLIVATTGSGKSTQIPAYLLHTSHRIAVTQPRRVAAVTLAQRVALEQHAMPVGQRIGYRVRFDDCTSHMTQLLYVTAGMLLREAMVDATLQKYSIVFVDEAHERSLQTDILIGVVQRARREREATARPLKVVVMSATLHVETFCDFFGKNQVDVLEIPGRQFFVQRLYTREPIVDYLDGALSTILQIHEHEPEGDVLVFIPGQEEIEDLASLLRQYLQEEETNEWTGDRVETIQDQQQLARSHHGSSTLVHGVLICLLYAALPPEAQLAAFCDKPDGCTRKVILSTNLAETSVTLPGIRYVVDSGKHKCRQVTSATGMESLKETNISKAQAAQRAGRAGRIASGFCFCLYTEDAFDQLPTDSVPEILRVNLAQVVLQLKGMGIKDPSQFDFVTKPDPIMLKGAVKHLYALEALDDSLELTAYGKKLAKLPLEPIFGHLLCQSATFSCVNEMLTAVSVLSAENVFFRPSQQEGGLATRAVAAHKRFASHEGDLPTYCNVYKAWQKEAIYIPPNRGGRKAQKKQQQQQSGAKLQHGEWCQRNFVSGRALSRAYHVRGQLRALCARPGSQHGLGIDVTSTCGDDAETFLKCCAAGLFLQAASRIKPETDMDSGRGRSGTIVSTRGRYRTKQSNETVAIHPTSTLFQRPTAPACVVYTEMVSTTKTYIRGVTQIREEWLHEVAPNFYK